MVTRISKAACKDQAALFEYPESLGPNAPGDTESDEVAASISLADHAHHLLQALHYLGEANRYAGLQALGKHGGPGLYNLECRYGREFAALMIKRAPKDKCAAEQEARLHFGRAAGFLILRDAGQFTDEGAAQETDKFFETFKREYFKEEGGDKSTTRKRQHARTELRRKLNTSMESVRAIKEGRVSESD